ncbi:MAG TPA: HEAT repeat domain-containing protein [Vicinamibacterales bacterium]|nr:HEAT repeat domain-containing protein [Vicinamibacterales bacterium]
MPTTPKRISTLLVASATLAGALTISARQTSNPRQPPRSVQLTAPEAARLAAEARKGVSVEMPPGLELKLYASDELIVDPVALEFDPAGTLYVTSTSRNNMPLDIRDHPTWVPTVHTLKTVGDLREFYRKELAPGRSAQNQWLPDLNRDGSHDERDLAELKERVYRLQDTDGDGIADTSRIMIEGFNTDPTYDIAGGLLWNQGDLLIGTAPGVWRLKDDNGDGTIDRQISISEGYSTHPAFGGHGISGLTMGPDGRIYWEVGDIGLDVTDKSGRRWSYPNQGAVMRSDPDGSNFEVFATGIRNLQEFSFDEYGNLISVDNDGDHQGETERLVYIPEGSDSGWRSNWQYGKYTDPKNNRYNVWMNENMFKPRFSGQAAHIVPPVAAYHSGPSGMVYNPGTALTDEWKSYFFVSSFPGAASNARIYGFKLKEDGAGFALVDDKVFLRGILTVGLKFGADGALYLADWITGWDSKNKGRVWKLDAPAAASNPMRAEVRKLIAENFASRSPADLTSLLRHADMRIRQKAQFELVRRGDVQPLAGVAKDPAHTLARIHAMWGVAQLARTTATHAALLTPLLADSDAEIRAQAAKLVGDLKYAAAASSLLPLLKDAAPRPRFFAAEALGRLAYKPATAPIVEMLAANDDKDALLRHAGALALSRIGDAAAIANLSTHASKGVRMAAIVALRRMRHADVARFAADSDEQIVQEAARAINDDGGIVGALPALAKVLEDKRFTSEPLLRRAISANLKVGSAAAVTRLAAFAADATRAEPMRVEAVAALGVVGSPSPMDRVDGIYLAQSTPGDTSAARAEVLKLLQGGAAAEKSTALRVALAEAAGRLEVQGAAPILLAQLKGDSAPEVRVASLRALQALKIKNMDEAMKLAVADGNADVRRAALTILPTLPLTDAAKVDHLSSVIRNGSVVDQQAGFDVLGTLKSSEAEKALGGFFDQLAAGKLPAAVQLDLVNAMQASGSASLQARLDAYQKSKAADTLVLAFRDALLAGGNPQRGRDVFVEHPAAACTRCHTVRNAGSDVGPNLNGVASRLSRDQILQSLLDPNAVIAPGFGTVGITFKNGQRIDGTLREETATEVVVLAGTPPAEQRVAKADIASRTNPVSAMPPVAAILKPRELRDVIAYLMTLQ